MCKRFGALAAALVCAAGTVRATDYYVGGEKASDSNDGTQDAPFATIDKAIATATESSDKIYVAPGEYQTNTANGPDLKVMLIGTGTTRDEVIISAGNTTDSNYRTLKMEAGSIVTNLTLVGNTAYKVSMGGTVYMVGGTIVDCVIKDGTATTGGSYNNAGGNIYCKETSCLIENCIISGGSARNRGGNVCLDQGTMRKCIVSDGNTSDGSDNSGGNIWTYQGKVYDCVISGGKAANGGNAYLYNANAKLVDCDISGGFASSGGGNVYNRGTLLRCNVTGGDTSSSNMGGGVRNNGSDATLDNCLIALNDNGGVLQEGAAKIYSCTIADNTGCGVYGYGSASKSTLWYNTAFYGNVEADTGNQRVWRGDQPNAMYNCAIDDSTMVSKYTQCALLDSNVFVDYAAHNYRPVESSLLCDAGVEDPRTTEASSTDLAGKDRVFGASVDIGCYEFQPICVSEGNANPKFPYNTSAKAYATIREALDTAEQGDSVWVYPGTYETSSQLTISKVVRVKGVGNSPDAVVVRNTSVAGSGNPYCRVFELNNPTSRIENLVMERGQVYNQNGGNLRIAAGVVSNCVIRGGQVSPNPDVNNSLAGGGGVEVAGSGVLTHCIITNNFVDGTAKESDYAYAGGAVFVPNGAAPKISNCLVAFNTYAPSVSSVAGSAGIRCGGSNEHAVFENVTVVSNVVNGTISDNSAGMYCTSWSTTVRNCVFAGNYVTGTDSLSAAYFQNQGHMIVRNCAMDVVDSVYSSHIVSGTPDDFFKNFANGDFRPRTGGKLYNKGATPSISTSVDLLGNPRAFGGTIDIGCYESQVLPGVMMLFF